ncbi:MAG: apolipoprotein N-acyltransferase [Bacteriovoracaceae bacterium]|jgi:apolipoprotein N-acyltransferase|nr:apolipoprotein N-acyltransferase [Bacteriovoracaceae bacterium]
MSKSFNLSSFKKYFAPLLGGSLYAMGFPMKTLLNVFFLPILGISLLIYCLDIISYDQSRKLLSRIKTVLLFSLSYCLTGYYWIPHTIKEFGEISFPINWLIGASFSLIIAPQFIFFLLSLTLFYKYQNKIKPIFDFLSQNSVKYIFLAFILTVFEYYIPQEFPAHLGHPWIQITPYLGLAPLFGAPIYSFIGYLMAFNICDGFYKKKLRRTDLSVLFILLLINFCMPLSKLTKEKFDHQDHLRLVQANIGNFLKVSAEGGSHIAVREILQQYLNLSIEKSEKQIDLVIWPETAYPRLLDSFNMKDNNQIVPRLFKEAIIQTGSELFVGGYDINRNRDTAFEKEFNSTFHFNQRGELKDVYHKMRLIPFGENLPFGFVNKYIAPLVKNISFFGRGKNYTLFKTQNSTPFVSAICYEILFSSFIRDFLNSTKAEPSFLINLTNDSWYGDTSEPHQHLALAKWRAIEFDIPLVRMTNTGITSIIFSDGTESERLDVNTQKNLDITLYTKDRSKTIFQRFGFLGITMFVGLLMVILYFLEIKKTRI